jgi:hypothetical protein
VLIILDIDGENVRDSLTDFDWVLGLGFKDEEISVNWKLFIEIFVFGSNDVAIFLLALFE